MHSEEQGGSSQVAPVLQRQDCGASPAVDDVAVVTDGDAQAPAPMMRGMITLVAVLALTSCGISTPREGETGMPSPPRPTSWFLSHDVIASDRIKVAGGSINAWEQTIEVVVDANARQPADRCFVQADVSGQGGPDRWVGEKIPTSVRGVPALRNGAGAEGPYLMWQDGNRRWITVQCEHEATTSVVANQVRTGRKSFLAVPFGLTPPDGYVVSSVNVTRDPLHVAVLLDRVDHADTEALSVTIDTTGQAGAPTGEPTTAGGHPALVTKDRQWPRICVAHRQTPVAYVCVGVPPNDTGPYPDRTDDLPAIETIAASLRFADVDHLTTWFDADQALR